MKERTVTCIECRAILPRDHVRLTERAAMCQTCYVEVEALWLDEFLISAPWQSQASYVPHPRELRERIEAVRARIGDEPRTASPTCTVYEKMRTAMRVQAKALRTI